MLVSNGSFLQPDTKQSVTALHELAVILPSAHCKFFFPGFLNKEIIIASCNQQYLSAGNVVRPSFARMNKRVFVCDQGH